MTKRLCRALCAGALLLASTATGRAQSCIQVGGNRCIPPMILVDPSGTPYTASGGGGGASNPATIYTAQVKITTTGTAVQLPTVAGTNGFTVRSKSSNTGVGTPALDCLGPSGVTNTSDGTGNGDCEPPGSGWAFGVSSSGAIYVNGAAGDVFFVNGN